MVLKFLDLDVVTFQLPVSSNFNHGDERDVCSMMEEFTNGNPDLLSMEPIHCAEQLTAMDAVSTCLIICTFVSDQDFCQIMVFQLHVYINSLVSSRFTWIAVFEK